MVQVQKPGGGWELKTAPSMSDEQLFRIAQQDKGKRGQEAWNRLQGLADIKANISFRGRQALRYQQTPTPGMLLDRSTGNLLKIGADGKKTKMSSADLQQATLRYKELMPTNDIRSMQQSVPSVKHLLAQTRDALERVQTGPVLGRFKNLMTRKVGIKDKNWTDLRTNMDLLATRLMKMHIGARGSDMIMAHFEKLLTSGQQSPENLKSVLDNLDMYADEVAQSFHGGTGYTGPKPQERPPANERFTLIED